MKLNDQFGTTVECPSPKWHPGYFEPAVERRRERGCNLFRYLLVPALPMASSPETALAWRIKRANLPENWSLASFPFARQPDVSRKQIHTLAELDFVAKAENLVLIGPTGVGKTGLASGLLLKALEEWIPLPVHPRTRLIRSNVCLAGRPLLASTAEPLKPTRCTLDR